PYSRLPLLKGTSAGFRGEPGGTSLANKPREARDLIDRDTASLRRDPVIAPPDIGVVGVRPLVDLLDQAIEQHARARSVQSARTESDRAVRAGGHRLHDGVAMPLALRKRDENLQHRRRDGHGPTIS